MPAVIPQNVNDARSGVAQAGSVLQDYAGKEFTIGEELKKVLNEATTPGKTDWANINATNMSNYLASPTKARAMYRDPESPNYIFNPSQSAAAMAEYTQADEIPFLASTQLFGLMMGGEKDMIDSGTNAFKAKQAAAQAAYQVAQQTYSDLLDEFKLTETLRQADEELAIKKMTASKSGGATKRDTQVLDVDGERMLVDMQSGEIIQNLGPVSRDPVTPSLINVGDKPYEYTPGAGLKQIDMPGGSGGDPWYKGIQDFFGWGQ